MWSVPESVFPSYIKSQYIFMSDLPTSIEIPLTHRR